MAQPSLCLTVPMAADVLVPTAHNAGRAAWTQPGAEALLIVISGLRERKQEGGSYSHTHSMLLSIGYKNHRLCHRLNHEEAHHWLKLLQKLEATVSNQVSIGQEMTCPAEAAKTQHTDLSEACLAQSAI
ncbi:hypothetical protein NDU88_008929 [Pleurodeles waltl]|uniref:Uncharacterized protein n=1 Tax=Pleurodeles waltl TaxID=8319 RepID=A0AAV7NXI2_PLEWA|nr:hypothetical protein NDU88_008929 [Pleurodeles waltl]